MKKIEFLFEKIKKIAYKTFFRSNKMCKSNFNSLYFNFFTHSVAAFEPSNLGKWVISSPTALPPPLTLFPALRRRAVEGIPARRVWRNRRWWAWRTGWDESTRCRSQGRWKIKSWGWPTFPGHGDSDGIRTLELSIMGGVFYLCATTGQEFN